MKDKLNVTNQRKGRKKSPRMTPIDMIWSNRITNIRIMNIIASIFNANQIILINVNNSRDMVLDKVVRQENNFQK